MDARIQRESDFHNKRFRQGDSRAHLRKFYEVCKAAKNQYFKLITAHCSRKKILEIGSGLGYNSILLAKKGAYVTGIDISEVAISRARNNAKLHGVSQRTNYKRMDAENIRFSSNAFDLIYGSAILHHLTLHKVFSELARLLKPTGRAVFFEPTGHNPFVNFYRKITPHLRTQNEHPLLMKDLDLAKLYFKEVHFSFYNNLSLGAFLFYKTPFFDTMLLLLDIIDTAIFTLFPFMKRYGWIVVIKLSKPQKIE